MSMWWLLVHWHHLQFTPCGALSCSWINCFLILSCLWSSLFTCAPFPSTIFPLPVNLSIICFDTALCKQPAFPATAFCGLPFLWKVSVIVFWTTVKSAVFLWLWLPVLKLNWKHGIYSVLIIIHWKIIIFYFHFWVNFRIYYIFILLMDNIFLCAPV